MIILIRVYDRQDHADITIERIGLDQVGNLIEGIRAEIRGEWSNLAKRLAEGPVAELVIDELRSRAESMGGREVAHDCAFGVPNVMIAYFM